MRLDSSSRAISRPSFLQAMLALFVSLLVCPAATAQIGQAPDVKRLALIMGNGDYDKNNVLNTEPGETPPPGHLKDLKNACRDAELFRDKLIAADWQPDEIVFPGCHLTADQMRDQITIFRERIVNTTNTLAIFYFSGHGAQFSNADTSHSFLFGAGAKIDLVQAAASLRNSPGNTSLVASQAVDLDELTSTLGTQVENGVLVILDACRNNPLYDELRDLDGSLRVEPISSNPAEFSGIVFAYSTPAGQFSRDGKGNNSIYTAAWASLIKPRANIDSLLNKLRGEVVRQTLRTYPELSTAQEPQTRGRFTNDWCIWACPSDQTPAPVALRAEPISQERLAAVAPPVRLASLGMARLPRPVATDRRVALVGTTRSPRPLAALANLQASGQPPVRTIYKSILPQTSQKRGINLDVFWCEGGAQSAERERRAAAITEILRNQAQRDQVTQPVVRGFSEPQTTEPIAMVRLRRLPNTANGSFGLRYTNDAIVYEPKDRDELAWSNFIVQTLGSALVLKPESARTPGYMSIFVCATGNPSNAVTTAFLQVPAKTVVAKGKSLLDGLTGTVPSVKQARQVEIRGDGPRRTELRFYHEADRNTVFASAAALQKLLDVEVRVQFLPQLASPDTQAHMEIWIGKDDLPKLAGYTAATP